MNILTKISQIFNKPFPEEESNLGQLKVLVFMGLFVFLFLFIFQPFGISEIETNKLLICLGFGVTTFIAMYTYTLIFNLIVKLKGTRGQWTFGKWSLNNLGIMFFISLANFLYIRILFFGYILWEVFPDMIYGTLMIGIIPLTVLGAILLSIQEKKYKTISQEINESKPIKPSIEVETPQSIYNIPIEQIRYVEALQNYVKIGFINNEGELSMHTARATLKGILEGIKGNAIIKCHRSYLVNREKIVSTAGNAQGLILKLSQCDQEVPVSRSYVPKFRQK